MEGSVNKGLRVLIVDPQPAMRQVLGSFLSEFYRLSLASNERDAIACLDKQNIDLMLLDEKLPGARQLIRKAQEDHPDVPLVVLSLEERVKQGVLAVAGCSFVTKRLVRSEMGRARLLLLIDRRIRDSQSARQSSFRRRQHQRAGLTAGNFLVGKSEAIESIREQTLQAAKSHLNLLITGETGVGKTLVAETVHHAGEHSGTQPYVTLDPSTLVPSLFESELFGHARGAFTGATRAQIGAFEAAHGGTLLLDEIGDLQLDLQRKLLQAVEERVIRRVGDVRPIHLEVRLIAATNRNLEADIHEGRFRPDLYQRLNELSMHIPPLRERREDVIALLEHFLAQFNPGTRIALTASARQILEDYSWPGNVREVRSLARRLSAQGTIDEIDEENLIQTLPARIDRGAQSDLEPEDRIRVFSRRTYLQALASHNYNIRGTARTLGMPYHTFRSRLKSLGLLEAVRAKRSR